MAKVNWITQDKKILYISIVKFCNITSPTQPPLHKWRGGEWVTRQPNLERRVENNQINRTVINYRFEVNGHDCVSITANHKNIIDFHGKSMLIRIVCSIKEKKLQGALQKSLSSNDVQLKFCKISKASWQELIRSCADIFIISEKVIPSPIDSNVSILNTLPEKPITIVLSDQASSEEHANLLGAGADVVLYSGISHNSLVEAIESTVLSRQQFYNTDRFDQKGKFLPKLNDFVSNSKEMQFFLDEVRQIIPSDTALLILGETGVGKEHLSRAIHDESPRSKGPFVAINMAAIPEPLMESELFGHEQGAFTGAVRSRRGAFELAHGGTLFLDEIGEIPLQMQSKLLRALQDFEFTPVGSEKPVWVDIRVISATNRNLEDEVKKGIFRSDLYYRIGVISLTLPPLRKRKDDIPILANHFLTIYQKKIDRDITGFSPESMNALCGYRWPGNIRELMNVIERAILLCKSDIISLSDLPSSFHDNTSFTPDLLGPFIQDIDTWKEKTLAEVKEAVWNRVEKKYLEMVLEATGGRINETAELAGIHPRGLYSKMKKLGLDKADFKKSKRG